MVFFDSSPWQSDTIAYESSLVTSVVDQEGSSHLEQPLIPKIRIEPESFALGDGLTAQSSPSNIQLPKFPTDRPWLPQKALAILEKLKKGPIPEKELITLMGLIAEQATDHYQLQLGKFAASTFSGRIVEVSDTRIGLLKKIQSRVFIEEIFVWRAGFPSFSGRT